MTPHYPRSSTTTSAPRSLPALRGLLAVCCAALALGGAASAQGTVVIISSDGPIRMPRPIFAPPPQPPRHSYKIKEIGIQARLVEQVAQVQVGQSFVNTGSQQIEVSFVFPLPYDGAIDRMTLLVDGKEYPAKLHDAKSARATYEEIVRRNRDPALLEWIGSGMFQTSVFPVPPGAERKVEIRYNQLCRKDRGLTDLVFPLSTAKYTSHPVENLKIQVNIESSSEVKNVYSPTHGVNVQRPDAKHAVVTFSQSNVIPSGDFRLFYDAGAGQLSASVLSYRPKDSDDGYFMLLASPQISQPDAARTNKTVMFVLDKSGSMTGEKIQQAKGALKFVLNNLREGDTFNLVAYDSDVTSFRPELEKFNEENRKSALGWIEGLYAGGGTNIDGALKAAFAPLKDSNRPTYILFLTDGLPTVGEQNELKISEHAQKLNNVRARIISFGVGYDVNSRLLDRLARENFGQSEYVRPNENLETQVAKVYSKIQSPVLNHVQLAVEYDKVLSADVGVPINRVYPKRIFDIFEGEQLVVVGRYRTAGRVKVKVSGKVGDAPHSFDFPADLAERSLDDGYGFIEKIWAMRRIGEIIDDLDLKGRNEELVKELVELSTRHGILTPYTSFLADENSNFRETASNAASATRNLEMLARDADGRSGFEQRKEKKAFQESDRYAATARPASPIAGAPLDAGASAPGIAGKPSSGGFGVGGGVGGPRRGLGDVAKDAAGERYRYADQAGAKEAAESPPAEGAKQNVQQIANRAFYYRGNDKRWIDSTVTEAMEKNAQRVKQFSADYFRLVDKHGKKLSQYLVLDEPMLVNLDGEVVFIDPAE